MIVKNIGSNMAEVQTSIYKILVSYSIPVAYQDQITSKYYRTDKKWSVTTSRHINKWLGNVKACTVFQSELDHLLG